MCMIIVKPAGIPLPPDSVLKSIACQNRDGFGYVTSDGTHHKTMHFDKFLNMLHSIPLEQKAIIHFRYATHGTPRISNCHPFHYKGIWMAHNGVMDLPSVQDKTDSQYFLEHYVAFFLRSFKGGILSKSFKPYLRNLSRILRGSRLAFMTGEHIVLHGNWFPYKGCWLSKSLF